VSITITSPGSPGSNLAIKFDGLTGVSGISSISKNGVNHLANITFDNQTNILALDNDTLLNDVYVMVFTLNITSIQVYGV
jgi:hypothetical protein